MSNDRATTGPGHAAYIEGPDAAGQFSWHCAHTWCGDGSGFETPGEAVAAAGAAGHPLAADAKVPTDPEFEDAADEIADLVRRYGDLRADDVTEGEIGSPAKAEEICAQADALYAEIGRRIRQLGKG